MPGPAPSPFRKFGLREIFIPSQHPENVLWHAEHALAASVAAQSAMRVSGVREQVLPENWAHLVLAMAAPHSLSTMVTMVQILGIADRTLTW